MTLQQGRESEWWKKEQQKRHTFHLWNNVVAILTGIYMYNIKIHFTHSKHRTQRQAGRHTRTHHRPIVWKMSILLCRVSSNDWQESTKITVLPFYILLSSVFIAYSYSTSEMVLVFFFIFRHLIRGVGELRMCIEKSSCIGCSWCWVEWVSLELKSWELHEKKETKQ